MNLGRDSDYFLELQTKTGWGRMLASFVRWCAPAAGGLALDVGCGPGLLPGLLTQDGAFAIGCDADVMMFAERLHPALLAADGCCLPFPGGAFELVTASNLLFLHPQPQSLLNEMARVVRVGGEVCLLNPSEAMSTAAAEVLANENGLDGLARETLLNYARRAEAHYRWGTDKLADMYAQAGLQMTDTAVRMGAGLVRYVKGRK